MSGGSEYSSRRIPAGSWRRAVLALAMVLLLTVSLGWPQSAAARGFGRRSQPGALPAPAGSSAGGTRLQEVSPPGAVQQLSERLVDRQPRLEIVAPAEGSLMPAGDWLLRLKVEDWPLVDAGPLGLGPHLVVQLDDEPPRRITSLETTMPELRPGSHRLTVYAARPWGEAVKAPGSFRQIRLQRVTANPLGLPARGTPQLIAAPPLPAGPSDPVLLDWLLLDAPLQNLRTDDTGWRLRITVNGDSFLVDRQTPLWLKGWRPGSNAILLELVDGRGEPLNPPFNTLVRELVIDSGRGRPAWQGERLDPGALARLLGEAAAEPEPTPEPATAPQPASAPKPANASERAASSDPAPGPAQKPARLEPQPEPEAQPQPEAQTEPEPKAEPLSEPEPEPKAEPLSEPEPEPAPNSLPPARRPQEAASADEAGSERGNDRLAQEESLVPPPPSRLAPAREEVNPDGTLIQPRRSGPLAGLRERLRR